MREDGGFSDLSSSTVTNGPMEKQMSEMQAQARVPLVAIEIYGSISFDSLSCAVDWIFEYPEHSVQLGLLVIPIIRAVDHQRKH